MGAIALPTTGGDRVFLGHNQCMGAIASPTARGDRTPNFARRDRLFPGWLVGGQILWDQIPGFCQRLLDQPQRLSKNPGIFAGAIALPTTRGDRSSNFVRCDRLLACLLGGQIPGFCTSISDKPKADLRTPGSLRGRSRSLWSQSI